MSQKAELLEILKRRKTIDVNYILDNHRHLYHRLAARIHDLKRVGCVIMAEKTGKHYTDYRYTLVAENGEFSL